MVHSQPKNCVVIDSKTYCETTPTTPEGLATALIGIPAVIIFWGITGFCVAKIVSQALKIDIEDNPLPLIAALLVPPMVVGLIILLLS